MVKVAFEAEKLNHHPDWTTYTISSTSNSLPTMREGFLPWI